MRCRAHTLVVRLLLKLYVQYVLKLTNQRITNIDPDQDPEPDSSILLVAVTSNKTNNERNIVFICNQQFIGITKQQAPKEIKKLLRINFRPSNLFKREKHKSSFKFKHAI